MERLCSLISAYLIEEMDHSALALSEYVYRRKETDEIIMLLLKSMYRLSYHERCIETIELNSSVMRIHEARVIYYRCKFLTGKKSKDLPTGVECDKEIKGYPPAEISKKSIRLLFEGLTKEDVKKKEILLEAYRCDNNNLEALLRMKNDSLVNNKEFLMLIDECKDKVMKEVYMEVFYPCFEPDFHFLPFYSPWHGVNLAKKYYRSGKDILLFNLGVSMVRLYPNSEHSFAALGLFFLMSLNYPEARRCFYKAAQINNEYGRGWLYLGMAYSGMKECESSITCLKIAHKAMIGSYKPSFYLAIEYHRMNNFERASFFYKHALGINPSVQVQERYISLLIYYEYYPEALSYLAAQKNNLLGLLRVYCNLFLGKVTEAQKHLSVCKVDWRYYATAGFIDHLLNNLDSAADNYSKALLKTHVNLVEELLGLAVENMTCKQTNNVYDYATDLFDNMMPKYSFETI
ncbi:putative cyclosome/anaphase-promoting complex protein [Encephalitozoon intestinalis ATCC 50506]|uniref:Cyclosome/anaphase-promoting complex protein n=1 Tax=Encephalitozoon intestinalis (strain ATCC 50506) TaxID=876142 RepID=E0S7D5_ENCIT|nr:putative cyclosome/anaphase-promoting complex protein [Encephalitozoon intestinalis ATCC 50506]ADM11614.1 putative cyclosome/anaphase-promoting complex protein [Encephalitozoon intestinalis ATCC 50506]UTX45341.1 cell division cycle protein 16-like protein [Encephalitozoon intestinalis]